MSGYKVLLTGLIAGWTAAVAGAEAPARPAAVPESDIRRDATVRAVEEVLPCVVNLATETVVEYHDWYGELFRRFYGAPGSTPRRERYMNLGSGVIIDEEGYVLTNFHVVRRATRIQVKLWDGREYDAIPLVATEGSDVALLKIRAKPGEKFKAVKFAKDDDLLLGETVLAMGNPFGLGSSVTRGILSSKNRRAMPGDAPLQIEDWLQTDATINPGNSGGPLVNLRGELIGLNVAVYREEEGRGMGMGFSIPVKQVSVALSRFFSPEVTHSLWFGAQVSGGGGGPLTVVAVQPGTPADQAGLREADQITLLNGERPANLIAFNRALGASSNRTARLQVLRGERPQNLLVRMVSLEDMIFQRMGLRLLQPTPDTASRLGIDPGKGLFVSEVESGSPADKAKLQDGYYLLGMEGVVAQDLRTLGEILSRKKPGERVRLNVGVPTRYQNMMQVRSGVVSIPVR